MDILLFGRFGDLIYELCAVKRLHERFGTTNVFLKPKDFSERPVTKEQLEWIAKLVNDQQYVSAVQIIEKSSYRSFKVDFEEWFQLYRDHGRNLADSACEWAKVADTDFEPWVQDYATLNQGDVLVNYTGHYPGNDPQTLWPHLISKFNPNGFLGLKHEGEKFNVSFGTSFNPIECETAIGLATRLSQCEKLLADQSFPLALRHAMGKPVEVDVAAHAPDCVFLRSNAHYHGISLERQNEVGVRWRESE